MRNKNRRLLFIFILITIIYMSLCLNNIYAATPLGTNILSNDDTDCTATAFLSWSSYGDNYWSTMDVYGGEYSPVSLYDGEDSTHNYYDFWRNGGGATGTLSREISITGLDDLIDSNGIGVDAWANMYSSLGGTEVTMELEFYNSSDVKISGGPHTVSSDTIGNWKDYQLYRQMPVGTRKIKVILKATTTETTSFADFDGIRIVLKQLNRVPSIAITNPTANLLFNGSGTISISGTASDLDGDGITVSATIDGHQAQSTVTGGAWTLTWNISDLNIAEGTYTNVVFTATDSESGTGSATYTGNITIDKTAPTVSSYNPAAGATNVGVNDNLVLTFNESVVMGTTGNIKIMTTVGGTTVETISVTSGIVTVSGNTVTIDPTTTLANDTGYYVLIDSGAIKDAAGNSYAGISDSTTWNFTTVDTTAPTLTTVTIISNNSNTSQTKTGDQITLGITASESIATPTVTIAGNAATVSGGGTTWTATYTMVGTETEGTIAFSISFSDSVGNAGTAVSATTNNSSVTYDKTAPTVSSVSVPSSKTYIAGDNLDFTVNFSEAVTVTTTGGTPYIPITLNTGVTVQAAYISGTGTSALVFRYTVVSGNYDNDGVSVGAAITANGGTIKDAAGNSATLTLNSVGGTTGVLVDAIAPTVSSVSVPSSGTYIAGQNLDFTVNFSEAVTTTGGTPYIPITIGSTTVQATYNSGSGSTALVFRYTVVSGNYDNDGVSVGAAITANGGTIKDSAGNSATLTLNSVSSTTAVLVDAVAPTLSNVSPTGLKAGTVISATSSEAGTLYLVSKGTYTSKLALSTAAKATATVTAASLTGSLDTTGLSEGAYQIYAVDSAGNLSSAVNVTISNNTPMVVFTRPLSDAKLNINTGSMVIAKLYDVGTGIDTSSVTIQIDGGTAVKPTKLVKTSEGYTLYYVITSINYGTTDYSHTITISVKDSTDTYTGTGSVTFTMEPKRKGFGFGRLRFD